ncbi:MAG: DUF1570 domain-containing protein, partial [Lentisphaerae bacterium]
ELRIETQRLPGWYFLESPHYFLKTDIRATNRYRWRDLLAELELLRRAYVQLCPPLSSAFPVGVLCVFASRSQYQQYVPPLLKWSLGLWIPSRGELLISPTDNRRQIKWDEIRKVTFHEAFHQYLFYASGIRPVPVWFNEGHAMLVEVAQIDRARTRIRFPLNQRRQEILEKLIDKDRSGANLKALLKSSPQTFYQEYGREHRYALAWGLVYFLRKGNICYPGRGYDQWCPQIWAAILRKEDPNRVLDRLIEGISWDVFYSDLRDFWSRRSLVRRAERNPLIPRL